MPETVMLYDMVARTATPVYAVVAKEAIKSEPKRFTRTPPPNVKFAEVDRMGGPPAVPVDDEPEAVVEADEPEAPADEPVEAPARKTRKV